MRVRSRARTSLPVLSVALLALQCEARDASLPKDCRDTPEGCAGAAGAAGNAAAGHVDGGGEAGLGEAGARADEGGSAGDSATGGSAGDSATGGSAGESATGGSAGESATGGTSNRSGSSGMAGVAGTGTVDVADASGAGGQNPTGGTAGEGGTQDVGNTSGAGGRSPTGGSAGEGGVGGSPLSAECAECVSEGYLCEFSTCIAADTAPPSPAIDGEASAGHSDVSWRWADVELATRYEVRVDGEAWVDVGTEVSFSTELTDGQHRAEVRACEVSCSLPSSFATKVEPLGPIDGPWRGVQRPLAVSPMGRAVGISCHNCYREPDGALLTDAEARAKVELALSRGADLVELDVAYTGTELCASHDDVSACSDRPTLAGVLASEAFAGSNAPLFMEIKEGDTEPTSFATVLLDSLDSRRDFVRNGRPVFIRAFASRLDYLLAIADALSDYPFIAPYVRFSVLYSETSHDDVAAFQDAVRADAAAHGFEWVEFAYTTSSLRALSLFARSLGLAVGVWTIPADDGAVHVTRLREDFDALTSDYRVDQARGALESTNLLARVDASRCASPADESVEVARNEGEPSFAEVAVGVASTVDAPGSPPLSYHPEGEPLFRCAFDFREPTDPGRLLDLGVTTATRGGYSVSTNVRFKRVALAEGEVMSMVANSQRAGFAVELAGEASRTVLRFGVRIDGAYRYHVYDAASTGLGGPLEVLNTTDAYHLVGAYPADGGTVKLWINGRSVGDGGSFVDAVTLSALHTQVGADPQELGTAPRYYFDGLLQEATVVDWWTAASGETN